MARLVMLYFEDNEAAEQFVNDDIREVSDDIGGYGEPPVVVGVYGVPTKFCDDLSHAKAGRSWGKKYGWALCGKCGFARRSYQMARNLLDTSTTRPYLLDTSTTRPFRAGTISFSNFIPDVPPLDAAAHPSLKPRNAKTLTFTNKETSEAPL